MNQRQVNYIRKQALRHKVNFQLRKDKTGNYLADLSKSGYPITETVSDVNTAMKKIKEIAEYHYDGTRHKVAERFGLKY